MGTLAVQNQNASRPSEHPPVKGKKYSNLKKNQNAPRPSSIPQSGGKNVKTFRWDHRLQYKTSSWRLNKFPYGSNLGSTVKHRGEAHRYTVHLLTLIAMQGHQKISEDKTSTSSNIIIYNNPISYLVRSSVIIAASDPTLMFVCPEGLGAF